MTSPRDDAAAAPRPLTERCSFSASARHDDFRGTAPTGTGFFLIEHPGAWGRLALEQSSIDPRTGGAIARACGAAGVRPLLVRRTGRRSPPEQLRWFRVRSEPGSGTIRSGTYADAAELVDVVADPDAGAERADAIVAVCTHGRHDPCCAIRGRPVAAAFAELAPELTWECSHVGGDRFAGNVVVLPFGLYYGWVQPADAQEVLAATAAHRVVPRLLRGRACHPPPVQAAQAFARAELGGAGVDGVDALAPLAVEGVDGTAPRWQVTLAHEGIRVRIDLERRGVDEPALLTCGARAPARPPRWHLHGIARTIGTPG